MTLWSIEPRSPIILRDGRPFGLNPGARAESLDFPFPSTIAGAVRTRHAQKNNMSFGDDELCALRKLAVRGPILRELADSPQWLVAAPMDAVLFPATDKTMIDRVRLRRLEPLETEVISDLSITTVSAAQWSTIGMVSTDRIKDKTLSTAPRYWYWQHVEKWLLTPADNDEIDLKALGHNGPEKESRTHVGIRPDTLTGEDGRLFQTRGLEFQRKLDNRGQSEVRSLALALETDADMDDGVGVLGGEQRLVRWHRHTTQMLPTCPPTLCQSIAQSKRCRLMLLTPALFRNGFIPTDFLSENTSVTVTLAGAALTRAQTVSGWDYGLRSAKPTRRLVPAGSVYFLKLQGDTTQIEHWVKQLWMHCISDDTHDSSDTTRQPHQERLDGFGLAVVGTW